MDLPQRKINRLKDYEYNQNGAYFITICTKDRRRILSHIVGAGSPRPKLSEYGIIANRWIQKIPQKYENVSLDHFVIMPDHIHLLLIIENNGGQGNPAPTVGAMMGWLKYQITKECNQTVNGLGESIFQRSYYDHVLRNEQDYYETWEYIENNPKSWVLKHM